MQIHDVKRALVGAVALAFIVGVAFDKPLVAQVSGGVRQLGAVSASHCVSWVTNNLVQDAGGTCTTGGGTPGGSNTQVQYNNNGVFGGISGVISNGTLAQFNDGAFLLENAAASGGATFHAGEASGNIDLTTPGITDTLVGIAATQTLTNKSLSGSANTFTNIGNAALTNSSLTLGSTSVSLGGTATSVTGLSINPGGSNAISVSGNVSTGSTGQFQFTGRTGISSPSAGFFQLGGPDAASAPASQTYGFVSAAGIANTAGANNFIDLSAGTGTGVGGNGTINCAPHSTTGSTKNAYVACIGINGDTGLVTLPLITSDAGLTDASVCEDTTLHGLHAGSGTLGICLGTSSVRFKHGIVPLVPGLEAILALKPKSFYLDKAHGDPTKQMYGFIAEDMVKVLPKLVGLDKQGRPNTADYLGVVPVLVKAVQQENAEIIALKAQNVSLRAANDNFSRRLSALEDHRKLAMK